MTGKQTSPKAAKAASAVLRSKSVSMKAKTTAASALAQAPSRPRRH